MADGRQRAQRPRRGEKHGWVALNRYVSAHERALERHRFVLEDLTVFDRATRRSGPVLSLQGRILCSGHVVIEVVKDLAMRSNVRSEVEIRGTRYGYHAHIPGRGNLLRYDNSHGPDEFHRHEYDFATQRQEPLELLTGEQFPTLVEVLDEVQEMAERLGLTR